MTTAAATTATQKPMNGWTRASIRIIYTSGLVSTGIGLYTLLVTRTPLPALAAAAGVLLVEMFAVTAASYATRARLRGERGLFTRACVGLGTLASAGMQLGFEWDHSPMLAVFMPVVSLLALVLWLLDVKDRYASVFAAQRAERRTRRGLIGEAVGTTVRYMIANGVRPTYTEWKRRTVEIGRTQRDALTRRTVNALVIPSDASDAPVAVAPSSTVVPTSITAASDAPGTDVAVRIPHAPAAVVRPARALRSVSAPPAVAGTDAHAEHMRTLASRTECIRYAWSHHGPTASPTDLVNWLASYGVAVGRSTVSTLRPAA